jgi:hypothetical protein
MRRSGNIVFFIVLFTVHFFSCTEPIDINLDSSTIRLVVEGSITTDTIAHVVKLSKTSSYFYNQAPESVTGASVTISDGKNVLSLTESAPGVYQTGPFIYGTEGTTYTLKIKLNSEIGGYSEYTASSKINAVAELDSIGLLYHPDWSSNGVWELKCFVQDPPTIDFYRFFISRNQTMITDTLNEWFVTDDRFFNGYYVNGATVGYLDQSIDEKKVTTGDTILLEMNNTGEEYANFLWESQSELIGTYPLFSGPPANVKGNISNGAIGFFAAYSCTRAYTLVK